MKELHILSLVDAVVLNGGNEVDGNTGLVGESEASDIDVEGRELLVGGT